MASEIVDIHVNNQRENALIMREEIIDGLSRPTGQKRLPTMLLYDERGLRLYDDITTEAREYYLFAAEEEILKNHGDEIVRVMHQGVGGVPKDEVVLELGSGALRKTSHVLRSLARLVGNIPQRRRAPITYYALDLEQRELQRTLGQITSSEFGEELDGKVATKGMWGSYDDGLKFVKTGGLASPDVERIARVTNRLGLRDISPASIYSNTDSTYSHEARAENDTSPPSTPEEVTPPLHILFLGSSLGNFDRNEQAGFLRALPLHPGSGDTLLLGMDHDNGKALIEEAYNDSKGYTRKFIMNGLKAAGRVMGDEELFDENKWEYVNEYDEGRRRHAAYYQSTIAQTVQDPTTEREFKFLEDEMIKVEESVKFSEVDAYTLFAESNLRPVQRWTDSNQLYSLWLLERPPFMFPLLSSPRACTHDGTLVLKKPYSSSPFGVPSPQDWENLWTSWDFITLRMIPPTMLYQKPIDLRHICLFYLGHIPAFLDIHLSRLLQEPHTEPVAFKDIFERGIDPIVDNPSQCHDHSIVPEKDEDWPGLTSILQFESRVRARLLKLYKDIDEGKLELTRKVGRVLFMSFEHEALHLETLLYMLLQRAGSGTLPPLGFSPPDWESLANAWDSGVQPEHTMITLGPETISLGHDDYESEDASADDVNEHEFGWDNEHPKRVVEVGKFRIEWRPVTNGQFYDFFKSLGAHTKGREVEFPSSWIEKDGEVHVRTLYGPVPLKIAKHWPIVTSYNNLSTYATVKGGRLPTEPELRLFLDKFESGYEGGADCGFRNWHPIPATTGTGRAGGKGNNGGVWEWTSTEFAEHDGFEKSKLYPGYSADFFDGAHQVVIGGSYATIPRISERRSFRNWYQKNYPYPWVGGRVVYNIDESPS